MKFRSEIKYHKPEIPKIDHRSQCLFLGSCFAQNIASKLDFYKVPTLSNPYGIMYNPFSISQVFQDLKQNKIYSDKDIDEHRGVFFNYSNHSSNNSLSKEALKNEINQSLSDFSENLKNVTHVFISLGTAYAYRLKSSGNFVGNCHKQPNTLFEKVLLDIPSIVKSSRETMGLIENQANNKVSFIFTLSPVRHLKDGFVENSISKAHLRAAIHEITSQSTHYYFPSYEILLDDLRDYRFYKEDLVHPSEQAIDYIWDHFQEALVSDSAKPHFKAIARVQTGLLHRPFQPNSMEHQKFKEKLEKEKRALEQSLGIKF
ncbi:MAG: GSCFA domain-containing protein [Flavobacteriaceae bacterium]